MKLIDFTKDNRFIKLRRSMGILDNATVELKTTMLWKGLTAEEIAGLRGHDSILDVDLKEVTVADDSTLEYKGQKVILYIRDQSMRFYEKGRGYKFHICDCETLSNMRDKNRYERYVVSTRDDGFFLVNLTSGGDIVREKEIKKLVVCINCLKKLNFKNYKESNSGDKKAIVEKFIIKDFFNKYQSRITFTPTYTDETAPLNVYANDQDVISRRTREKRNWTCEGCGINLMNNKQLLHVHHINGMKSDNRESNLKVLCIHCHSKEDGHERLKYLNEFNELSEIKSF